MKHFKTTVRGMAFFVMVCSFLIIPDRSHAARENVLGQWITLMNGTVPSRMPLNAIHTALLDNGRLVIVAGSENDPANKRKVAAVWDPKADPNAAHIAVRNIQWDLFCNGMSHLPDGRVAIVGGTAKYLPSFTGINNTIIYSPIGDTFTQGPSMEQARWYPTNTVLGDGRTLTISGTTDQATISRITEILDTSAASWRFPSLLNFTPALYPRGHLMPDGSVFYSGYGSVTRSVIPNTGQAKIVATHLYQGDIGGGSAVLLPLRPPYTTASVLSIGGGKTATNTVERITFTNSNFSSGTWTSVPSMTKARVELNATLLPTGEVLATGGSSIALNVSTAHKEAELYNPWTNRWSTMASASYGRLYHSLAILLPDATVWTAGSNPARGVYDTHMEIYRPYYLFTTNTAGQVVPAPRPVINAVSFNQRYGIPFNVSSANAADIASVAMIKLGAVTHAFDMDQRLLFLNFSNPAAGVVRVVPPPATSVGHNVAPPGPYMLFLVNKKGVPSVAKIFYIR